MVGSTEELCLLIRYCDKTLLGHTAQNRAIVTTKRKQSSIPYSIKKVQIPQTKMVPWVVCFQGRLNLGVANTQTKNIPEY